MDEESEHIREVFANYGLALYLAQALEKGISILKHGGVVAFPTDTVYGLGARADIGQAVERIYKIKERPQDVALPLLLADVSQISEIAESVSQAAWLLVREFLPGALTIVLFKSNLVSDIVTAGGETVAVRIPAHPVPVALIEGVGAPIVGTSANRSGNTSALTADEVRSQFGNRIDLVIDGGECTGGRESTIVDMTGENPVILREGAIPTEEIMKVCKTI